MNDDAFESIEQAVARGGSEAAFDLLVQRFRDRKQLPQLFEARLLKRRFELGLPLIQTQSLGELPDDTRHAYEDAYITAAREVGGLYLEGGDVARAWPYFRAIGEIAPVAAAIERIGPGEGLEPIIEIAFHERVNPRKGFELILANYGTCSAITTFEQYPARDGREDCIRLLVRKIHGDLVDSLHYAIGQREGQTPESRTIPELLAGRDWLFEDNNYHVDTSHLASVIRFSCDLTDSADLRLAVELTEYGQRLSELFQYRGNPPFEEIYVDYGRYLEALLGGDAGRGVEHFRQKLAGAIGTESVPATAQSLINLLARLGRYAEAIDIAQEHLAGTEPGYLTCPTAIQLCELAGDRTRMREVARRQDDLVSFTAALVRS